MDSVAAALVCSLWRYTSVIFLCLCLLCQIPSSTVRKSDMLPNGWSDGGGVYSLMYQRLEPSDPATYFLKVISVDGMMIVHLLVSLLLLSFRFFYA